jgi:hypothetical protein
VYTVNAVKKSSKKDTPPPEPKNDSSSSPESLKPSIDGPPSPERIRAYTEQMKRSSIFGNNSRTNTLSSASSSSFRSRDSTSASTDNLSLSRKSSNRSNASSMPSVRSERPESVQIFGSIFSRGGRRAKKDHHASISSSGSSSTVGDSIIEEAPSTSAKDHYYNKKGSRRKNLISGPYNFQHVTHTRQDHLPNLERTSRMELVSEFSAIRASQVPTHGELKGIRAQDLHFENFSSEALSAPSPEEPPSNPKSPRQRSVLRKSVTPPQLQLSMPYAKSVDNLGKPPPRPPRSPLSPICPVALPARTSSRTASQLFDTFDPLASTSIERPHTTNGFRRPAPFALPTPPPPPPRWDEQQQFFSDRPMSHAVTTPGDEAWPLTASLQGNFGGELADVQEEEEEIASRRSRMSTASAELRMSQSVPALRRSYEQSKDRPETRMSNTLGRSPSSGTTIGRRPPLSPGFQLTNDSWESDIDWCYEHEVEADCDYQWDRCSVEDEPTIEEPPSTYVQPTLELHLQDNERTYHGRFRPSLLVPSPYDLPELSPMSNISTASSDPRTPAHFLRPNHTRSPSHASSFKESHGFHLSPTLLIPADFQSQMEHDTLYYEHYNSNSTSATIFIQDPYSHSISPVDEGASSSASYRSSNFSRGSARSSSSTRISGISRGSQDSMMLLGRVAGINQDHRSMGSASSLPDLIPSRLRQAEFDLSASVGALKIPDDIIDSAPAPEISDSTHSSLQHRRNKSLVSDQGLRKGVSHFAPQNLTLQTSEPVDVSWSLSPVAESFVDGQAEVNGQTHRKQISAPVVSPSVREFKGRARAATTAAIVGGKRRGSYMLFPQV